MKTITFHGGSLHGKALDVPDDTPMRAILSNEAEIYWRASENSSQYNFVGQSAKIVLADVRELEVPA